MKNVIVKVGGNEEMMVALMKNLVKRLGHSQVCDKELFIELTIDIPEDDSKRGFSERRIAQITFGIVMHRAFNVSLEEARKHILERTAIKYCFQLYSESDEGRKEIDELFKNSTPVGGGFEVAHTCETDEDKAFVMNDLTEEYNSSSPMVPEHFNSMRALVHRFGHAFAMTDDNMAYVGFANILHLRYRLDFEQCVELVRTKKSISVCFDHFLKEKAMELSSEMVGKTENTTLH